MQTLIDDLLAYSRVGTRGQEFASTAVEKVLDRALTNLQIRIADSGAVITTDPLPTVIADRHPIYPTVPKPNQQRHQVPQRPTSANSRGSKTA